MASKGMNKRLLIHRNTEGATPMQESERLPTGLRSYCSLVLIFWSILSRPKQPAENLAVQQAAVSSPYCRYSALPLLPRPESANMTLLSGHVTSTRANQLSCGIAGTSQNRYIVQWGHRCPYVDSKTLKRGARCWAAAVRVNTL